MPKRKNLNGLSHNLIKIFFGTERYYVCGYMADWLFNAGRQLGIKNATIDILNSILSPAELNKLHALTHNLKDLPQIIDKEVKGNGFPDKFIIDAKIHLQFVEQKRINCFPILVDKDGHSYEPGQIVEYAYESSFDPFEQQNLYPIRTSLVEKIKSIFK